MEQIRTMALPSGSPLKTPTSTSTSTSALAALAARRALSRSPTPPGLLRLRLHRHRLRHHKPTTKFHNHHPTPSLTPPPTASRTPSPTAATAATPPPAIPRRHSLAPPAQPYHPPVPRRSSVQTPQQHQQQQQQIHNPLDPRYLGNIPFSYTTDKLREWGTVYLFNAATADAFVRAISTSTSTSTTAVEIKVETPPPLLPPPQKHLVTVKIIPSCKTHTPFFMQKSFPIRAGAEGGGTRTTKPPRHRSSQRPAVPIHIEYALYRTPLLAAVLLCKHVKRGDVVEIPLPFPEVWEEVVQWVYTGGVAGAGVSAKVRETVEYLGGRI